MVRIAITPVPKPRMTQRDKWQQRPAVMRYRAYGDELRLKLAGYELLPMVKIVFSMPMPASWSAKKRSAMANTPHQSRPDLDNLVKAVFDHLATEDGYIWFLTAAKVWATTGGLDIEHLRKEEDEAGKKES